MATLSTGPFVVPRRICNGNPVNFFFISFTNLSNRMLTVTLKIHQIFTPPNAIHSSYTNPPPSPCSLIHPPALIRVEPNSAVMLSQSVVPPLPINNSKTASNDQLVLIISISGNVDKSSRDLIQICVTGGFSSDGGSSLNEAEPTMFFRHADFVVIHRNDSPNPPHHPLEPNHDKDS
jgi:hypothetical protein